MIIAFEGMDGTGKTTVSKLLYQKLKSHGVDVDWFPIDVDKSLSEQDSKSPFKAYNYFLNSLNQVTSFNKKEFLIFDRYYPSALGYLLLRTNQQVNSENIHDKMKNIRILIPKADITFILYVPDVLRIKNIMNKENIDKYDIESLKSDNIIFWNNFYRLILDKSIYRIYYTNITENFINKLIDIIFGVIPQNENESS